MKSISRFDNEEGDGFALATLFYPLGAEFPEACELGHNFDVACGRTKAATTLLYNSRQAKDYFKGFSSGAKYRSTYRPTSYPATARVRDA